MFYAKNWFRAQIAPYLKTIQDAIAQGGAGGGASLPAPVFASTNLVVAKNTQLLFAEPIAVASGAEIEIQDGAVLREVC